VAGTAPHESLPRWQNRCVGRCDDGGTISPCGVGRTLRPYRGAV